jgi:hypothetical protein
MGVTRGRKQRIDDVGLADDASNLAPNPFPGGYPLFDTHVEPACNIKWRDRLGSKRGSIAWALALFVSIIGWQASAPLGRHVVEVGSIDHKYPSMVNGIQRGVLIFDKANDNKERSAFIDQFHLVSIDCRRGRQPLPKFFVGEQRSNITWRIIMNEFHDRFFGNRVSRIMWNHGADSGNSGFQRGTVPEVPQAQPCVWPLPDFERLHSLSIWTDPRAIAGNSILFRKVVGLAHRGPLKESDSDIYQSGERDYSLKANFEFLGASAVFPPLSDSAGNVAQVHWYWRILAGLATLIVAGIFLVGFVGTLANIEGCFTIMLIGAISVVLAFGFFLSTFA